MIETKQLNYFVTVANCRSFSRAAEVLFASQSSVSKIIGNLESSIGYHLFRRTQEGILLTERGEIFYKRAIEIMDKLDDLEEEVINPECSRLRISVNSSSWFAARFSEFYDLHREEEVFYNIHTDSTMNIVQRIRRMEDEIAFVYVVPGYAARFELECKQYQLCFRPLARVDGRLYFFPENNLPGEKQKQFENNAGYSLIQAEDDKYMKYQTWTSVESDIHIQTLPVRITTNSDYIMNLMLQKPDIANISAGSFSREPVSKQTVTLQADEGKIMYGILYRSQSSISQIGMQLIDYICKTIEIQERLGVLAAAWPSTKCSSTGHACDPPEALTQSGIVTRH